MNKWFGFDYNYLIAVDEAYLIGYKLGYLITMSLKF